MTNCETIFLEQDVTKARLLKSDFFYGSQGSGLGLRTELSRIRIPALPKLTFFSRSEIATHQIGEPRKTVCPVENCGEAFKAEAPLFHHYGVGHGLVIQHYLESISGSPAGNALVAFRSALGLEPLTCEVKLSREQTCG